LNFIELDDAINLGSLARIGGTNITYEEFYQEASVEIENEPGVYETEKGEPIVYGITILKNARNKDLAAEFVALLLSQEGQDAMEASGQPFIQPVICDHAENLPALIKEVL
jgi:molybdate/tungstate transport system substrate-binding protein